MTLSDAIQMKLAQQDATATDLADALGESTACVLTVLVLLVFRSWVRPVGDGIWGLA